MRRREMRSRRVVTVNSSGDERRSPLDQSRELISCAMTLKLAYAEGFISSGMPVI